MKKYLEALAASMGCTPLLALGLFLAGGLIGQMIDIYFPSPLEWSPPPQWLLASFVLCPLFSSLYVRAYIKRQKNRGWFDVWPQRNRQKVVGQHVNRPSITVEEVWLQQHLPPSSSPGPAQKLLDNAALWGWLALISLSILAYICLWFGVMVSAG